MQVKKIFLLLLCAICLIYGGHLLVGSLLGKNFDVDFASYYVASRLVLDGKPDKIYDTGDVHTETGRAYGVDVFNDSGSVTKFIYPPAAAVLLAPFALTSFKTSGYIFFGASIASLLLTVWLFFSNRPKEWKMLAMIIAALAIFSFFPTYDMLYMGQVNAVVLLLCVLSLFFARKEVEWLAGLCLALAVLIKLFPIVLLGFFLIKRKYVTVVTAIIFMVAIMAISLLVVDVGPYKQYFSSVIFDRTSGGAAYRNQGFEGFFSRLLTQNDFTAAITDNRLLASILSKALGGLAILAALLLTRKEGKPNSHRYEFEFGLFLAAAFLAIPKAWEHTAVFLLLLFIPLTEFLVRRRPKAYIVLFIVFVLYCGWGMSFVADKEYLALPKTLAGNIAMSAKFFAALALFVCAALFLMGRRKADLLETVDFEGGAIQAGKSGLPAGQQTAAPPRKA